MSIDPARLSIDFLAHFAGAAMPFVPVSHADDGSDDADAASMPKSALAEHHLWAVTYILSTSFPVDDRGHPVSVGGVAALKAALLINSTGVRAATSVLPGRCPFAVALMAAADVAEWALDEALRLSSPRLSACCLESRAVLRDLLRRGEVAVFHDTGSVVARVEHDLFRSSAFAAAVKAATSSLQISGHELFHDVLVKPRRRVQVNLESDRLSEYELQRQSTIADNACKLAEIMST